MRRWLLGAVAAALALAGCGGAGSTSTTTATSTSVHTITIPGPSEAHKLGHPRGEGAGPLPVAAPGPHPTYHAAAGCGIERWSVKTGTDPAASAVNLAPRDTTIAALSAIAAPAQPTDRVAPTETTTWRLQGTITAVKQENDLDLHLVVTDQQGNTMIAESPATSCDGGSVWARQIATVRAAIDQACPSVGSSYQNVSIPAELTGVGFFDRRHGQRGVANNGAELHPLLAIRLAGKC